MDDLTATIAAGVSLLTAGCVSREFEAPVMAEPQPVVGVADLEGFAGASVTAWARVDTGVTPVGDVDGDGLDDVILYARGQTNESHAELRILYGRSERLTAAFPLAESVPLTSPGPWASTDAPVCLGDLDSDGAQEFGLRSNLGLTIFRGHARAEAGDSIHPWTTVDCDSTGFNFPRMVGIGDVDGDGASDLGFTDEGRLLVITGDRIDAAATLDCSDGVPVAELGEHHLEWPDIAPRPGDFDNDGFDDIVVLLQGRILVVYGGPDLAALASAGFEPANESVIANGIARHAVDQRGLLVAETSSEPGIQGPAPILVVDAGGERWHGDRALAEVARPLSAEEVCNYTLAGDLDADGYGDVLATVGRQCSRGATGPIELAVWYGSAPQAPRPADGRLVLPSFPEVVRGIGDFDGDGFDDFVASFLTNQVGSRTHLVYGAPRG